ncbi:putative Rab-GTPase-TBC domain-containing protein [Helianthus annuus]|uniref:Putative ypt/Rab-GAP domain of gyp1p superfamily protein n=1 Tax=Helianthus annuus TaxID=4232 RepID=A0A251VAK6_HELAN|nr:small G protein signaling modulator 1 isoform X1 [Helianthus annuus]KAF5816372.1 putative Rab-GTPase-TBC domain-containing protein [Helianthus annuus]KAJ0937692.1 putative Rab-GTPase-TBC domain-containing protein [Helianthus annuus]KAJ0945638.1 putative Rab-GTPase-TBC domain-containing protein [Helianthus annuus]
MMSFDGDHKQWTCGKSGTVNLQRVGSMVRDIGEPCLHQSPIKVVTINKKLKPEKWQTTFDSDGKVFGFQKALKLIMLGGVDPSIRPEVWEFLLGCYALSSTADYRRKLRTARRERYRDLVKQCQSMHSSIGTGSLAYVVGNKVMDMRTTAKEDEKRKKSEVKPGRDSSVVSDRLETISNCSDCASYDDSYSPYNGNCTKSRSEGDASEYRSSSYYDFPPLPVTNLFDNNGINDENESKSNDERHSTRRKLRFEDDRVYDFQINNNVDLVMDVSTCNDDSRSEVPRSSNMEYEIENIEIQKKDATEILSGSPVRVTTTHGRTRSQGQDRVSEWLWTLHQIVVDVVRTDSHLEFYENTQNLARMSDILAVYAWVDPATGYCQGMSDLLSPFIVLFEDNADAFWCFEMFLRRMRENFQMEGTTGVMKQLEALWHILEHVDREMFTHLSQIGAESLHFAFRMLLVLFRRELSFSEALCMWEMMWAADFDESLALNLENSCPELLVLQIPSESTKVTGKEVIENENGSSNGGSEVKNGNLEHSSSETNGIKPTPSHPFCGLTKSLWSKSDHFQICTIISSTRNGDDELPIFCVAAILILNRHKIMRDTRSIDDLIKIFNDNLLKIRVKRCIRTAIKLRKKYFYKLIKNRSQ